jgi:hypothetical protein
MEDPRLYGNSPRLLLQQREDGMQTKPLGNPANFDEFVMSIVAKTCNLPRGDVALQTTLQSLGIDSLVIPAIIARLEAAYDHEFTHQQTMTFLQAVTVHDMVSLTRESVGSRVQPAAGLA